MMITMEMWREAKYFSNVAKAGDEVEKAIVDEFANCVRPNVRGADYVQCGEAYSMELDEKTGRMKETYSTFERRDGKWYFVGNCFMGENVEPRFKEVNY